MEKFNFNFVRYFMYSMVQFWMKQLTTLLGIYYGHLQYLPGDLEFMFLSQPNKLILDLIFLVCQFQINIMPIPIWNLQYFQNV